MLFAFINIALLGYCLYAGYQQKPYTDMINILLFMSFIKAYNKTTLKTSSETAQTDTPFKDRITHFIVIFMINIPFLAISVAILYGFGYLAQHLFN